MEGSLFDSSWSRRWTLPYSKDCRISASTACRPSSTPPPQETRSTVHFSLFIFIAFNYREKKTICIKSKFHSTNIFDFSSTDISKSTVNIRSEGGSRANLCKCTIQHFLLLCSKLKLHQGLFSAASVFTPVHSCLLLVIPGPKNLCRNSSSTAAPVTLSKKKKKQSVYA